MLLRIIIGLTGLLLIFSCSKTGYNPGEIYSVDDGEGKIGIVKVLAVNPEIIHLRIYKNKFENRPKVIDSEKLSLGSIEDKDGFGIGHIPMNIQDFDNWKPELLAKEIVSEEELQGYKVWEEQ